jgi:hypothetical protein
MNLPPPSGPPAGSDYRSPAPEPRSGSALKRAGGKYRAWPLWAKIAAPGAAIFIGLGAIGAVTEPAEPVDADEVVPVAGIADPPAPTPAPTVEATTVPPTTAPPSTAAPTTPPTTVAPTTVPPPPTTAAPTLPPTTAAPTLPPTTAPPPPPPPPPPAPVAVATDPNYGTCKEAKAHGAGPYYKGTDPEYGWYRDADSDGIVCE